MGTTDDVHDMMRSAAEKLDRLRGMRNEMADLRGEGEAADGKVRASVLPGGAPQTLELDPRAMKMASEDLAEAILEAIRVATDDAATKAAGLLDSVFPGAGRGLATMATDQTAMEHEQEESEATVESVLESLRRGSFDSR
ncbi:MAG: YbaB/EbfC family nucleoid-associated protein [Actinopolymorphaceae bacterium]